MKVVPLAAGAPGPILTDENAAGFARLALELAAEELARYA